MENRAGSQKTCHDYLLRQPPTQRESRVTIFCNYDELPSYKEEAAFFIIIMAKEGGGVVIVIFVGKGYV